MDPRKKIKHNYVCLCNGVDAKAIEKAIENGAHTIDEIFDETRAGVGACGGSCRPFIQQMIDGFLNTGTVPKIERKKRRR